MENLLPFSLSLSFSLRSVLFCTLPVTVSLGFSNTGERKSGVCGLEQVSLAEPFYIGICVQWTVQTPVCPGETQGQLCLP